MAPTLVLRRRGRERGPAAPEQEEWVRSAEQEERKREVAQVQFPLHLLALRSMDLPVARQLKGRLARGIFAGIETVHVSASFIAPGTMPSSPEPGTKLRVQSDNQRPLNLEISGVTGSR